MSGIASHLVRRSFEATQQHYNTPESQDDAQIKRIATWGMVLLWATGIVYLAIVSAISYTYGDVVATLAMIETPTATAFKVDSGEYEEVDAPLLSEEQKSEKMRLVESDLFLVKQAPVTSKMRTAIKHLKAQAGRWSRFRGLHVAMIYHIAHSLTVNFLISWNRYSTLRPFIAVITTIVLCRLQMTWTHIVISAPSTKRWYQRYPSVAMAKNIIVPTAVFALAEQAAVYVPRICFLLVGDRLANPSMYGENPEKVQKIALIQMFFVALVAFASIVLIVIPADVTLKRVQASMLPEEDESIVPFDRTFGGKVKPQILGGSGAVGMLDAWKSFDKSARVRLIKLYAKIFAVQVATTVMFFMVVAAELRLIMGDELAKATKLVHAQWRGQ